MKRFPILFAALIGAALVFGPVDRAEAAKKKSSAKKPATEAKKAKADEATEADSAASKKAGAPVPLDLPLPTKPEPGGLAESGAPQKGKPAEEPTAAAHDHAPNATMELEDIVEFAAQPPRIQQLLRDAVELTRLNLPYTSGGDNPDSGGMDGSGAIYYLLRAHRFTDLPRKSSDQYLWARKNAVFFPVVSKRADGVEFDDLLPGDLLFWTGADDPENDVPISRVMLYLGREKATGKRVMFGASDSHSYHGIPRLGVSVFDFETPKSDPEKPGIASADFVGYARIPGLRQALRTPVAEPNAKAAATGGSAAKSKSGEAKAAPSGTKSKSGSRKRKR